MQQQFEAIIESGERGRVFIRIPFDPKEVWGKQSRYQVTVNISGHVFHTSLGSRDGSYFFPFNKEMQQQCGLQPGDKAQLHISPADENTLVKASVSDFEQALKANPQAAVFYEGLSSFYRNTYIKWIESAKQDTTRNKRIAAVTDLLAAGEKQK
jgi:hypothetical protein